VTPLDVFSTTEIGDTGVVNMTRLLQSLDTDGDPDNGITISPDAAASATGLSVDFNSASFDSEVINLVANSGSSTQLQIQIPLQIHRPIRQLIRW